MEGSSPARLYALLIGGGLVVGGIGGFFYAAGFDTGDSLCANDGCRDVFGIFAVNGWQNLLHITTGAAGLVAVSYGTRAQRNYALYLGLAYIAAAVLGIVGFGGGNIPDNILKAVPANTEDNVLHAVIGLLGVGAALATPKREAPQAATATYSATSPP